MAASKWYNYYGRKLWRLTMAYQALYRKYRPQLFADVLGQNGNVWKIITSIIVVVVNYLGSKLLVFRK